MVEKSYVLSDIYMYRSLNLREEFLLIISPDNCNGRQLSLLSEEQRTNCETLVKHKKVSSSKWFCCDQRYRELMVALDGVEVSGSVRCIESSVLTQPFGTTRAVRAQSHTDTLTCAKSDTT